MTKKRYNVTLDENLVNSFKLIYGNRALSSTLNELLRIELMSDEDSIESLKEKIEHDRKVLSIREEVLKNKLELYKTKQDNNKTKENILETVKRIAENNDGIISYNNIAQISKNNTVSRDYVKSVVMDNGFTVKSYNRTETDKRPSYSTSPF